MIIPGSSRISSKTVSKPSIKSKDSYGKYDMYTNYDLEKARKKALLQKDGILGSKPHVMPSTVVQKLLVVANQNLGVLNKLIGISEHLRVVA